MSTQTNSINYTITRNEFFTGRDMLDVDAAASFDAYLAKLADWLREAYSTATVRVESAPRDALNNRLVVEPYEAHEEVETVIQDYGQLLWQDGGFFRFLPDDRDGLRALWERLDTPIARVLDDDGVNMGRGQVRTVDVDNCLYMDEVDGFKLISHDDVDRLNLDY